MMFSRLRQLLKFRREAEDEPSKFDLGWRPNPHIPEEDQARRAYYRHRRENYPELTQNWWDPSFRQIEDMTQEERRLDRALQVAELREREAKEEETRRQRAEALAMLEGSVPQPAPETDQRPPQRPPVQWVPNTPDCWKAWHMN